MKFCKSCGNQKYGNEEYCVHFSDQRGAICGGAFFDMDDFKNNFHYDRLNDAYIYGNMANGVGAYLENGKWEGNVVVDGDVEIGFGPYDSLEEAKLDLMKGYFKKCSRFGEYTDET